MRALSEGVEHALHCLRLLAALPDDVVLPGKALAAAHEVSESYLFKHLVKLVSAGIVSSHGGPRGGYRLSRDPKAVTVLEVLEAIEGSEPLFRGTGLGDRGPLAPKGGRRRPVCPIETVMHAADRQWREALSAVTISDLLEQSRASLPPRSMDAASEWLRKESRELGTPRPRRAPPDHPSGTGTD